MHQKAWKWGQRVSSHCGSLASRPRVPKSKLRPPLGGVAARGNDVRQKGEGAPFVRRELLMSDVFVHRSQGGRGAGRGPAIAAGLLGVVLVLSSPPTAKAEPRGPAGTGRPAAPLQLAQSNDPFGSLIRGLMGVPENNPNPSRNVQPAPAPMQPVTGDPIAGALRQIELGHAIQEKSETLQRRVRDVIYRIKVFQAQVGGIWYRLGLQLNELYKLDADAETGWVKQFIAATERKRISGQSALKFVQVNAVDDIRDQNHTIARNNAKIEVLRQSVAAYVNALSGDRGFEELVARQDIPLEAMMNAYLVRVEEVTATLESASRTFGRMSNAYRASVGDMELAIGDFNQQSGLLTANAIKHAGVVALEIAHVRETLNNSNNNFFQLAFTAVQGIQIVKDGTQMVSTLNSLADTHKWFDAHSLEILHASRGAQAELIASASTLRAIRPRLMESWQRNSRAASEAAAALRGQTIAFEQQLEVVREKGRQRSEVIERGDLSELNALLKRPRRLKSSS